MTTLEPSASPYVIPLSRKWITRAMVLTLLLLLIAHLVFQYLRYYGGGAPWSLDWLFSVDEEASMPTWFSAASLMLCTLLLLGIGNHARRARDRDARYWFGLAIGFALMSLDEIAGVHETINTYLAITWTVPGAVLAGVIGLLYVRFLMRLPARTRWLFLAAGAMFVGGEMGVQFGINAWLFNHSMNSFAYNVLAAIGKGLKMGGEVLFVYALLCHMSVAPNQRSELVLEARR